MLSLTWLSCSSVLFNETPSISENPNNSRSALSILSCRCALYAASFVTSITKKLYCGLTTEWSIGLAKMSKRTISIAGSLVFHVIYFYDRPIWRLLLNRPVCSCGWLTFAVTVGNCVLSLIFKWELGTQLWPHYYFGPDMFYWLNCTKFVNSIFGKIIRFKIVATRCQIVKAKMHQIRFWSGICPRPCLEAYCALSKPILI